MIKVKRMFNFDSNSIDPTSMIPLYKQVANVITEEIDMGNIAAGEKLPSELLLMKVFNVSRVTIRGAILELVSDGLLIRSQGKGTFVAPKKKLHNRTYRVLQAPGQRTALPGVISRLFLCDKSRM